MDDKDFRDLLIRKLEKLEERSVFHDEKNRHSFEKTNEAIQAVRDEQLRHSIILSLVERDLPDMKLDLFEHKEGNIQNRHRIMALEIATREQDVIIEKAVSQYRDEVQPVILHVKAMQELPSKIKNFIISASKIMGAITVILGSTATIVAYFMGWLGR